MKKIIFIDPVHSVLHQRLHDAGYVCENHFETPRAELIKIIGNCFGLVIRSRITLDREFLDAADSLRFIARSGSGLENIDIETAHSRGIVVFNSPEGNRDAVAEHAIGMLLMLMNNLKRADIEVRSGLWRREENRGHEISGKTVGVIGYGVMGRCFAEKISGFGCRIIAHDKYQTAFSSDKVQESGLEKIYSEADIVSIHLPLTEETFHYADENFFGRFSKPICLINTARGKNVKTAALVSAMKSGAVSGACLDVLEYEKASLESLDDIAERSDLNYIMQSDRVVLSPHIAGWTHESYFKLSDVLAEKILALFPVGN